MYFCWWRQDEEAQAFYKFLNESYAGIQLLGMAKVSAEDKGDELVVNAVNGDEVDCVIAALSAPIREEFAENNKHLLNARVWLGVGKMLKMTRQDGSRKMRFVRFMTHRFFKREIQKNRKEIGADKNHSLVKCFCTQCIRWKNPVFQRKIEEINEKKRFPLYFFVYLY